jgi:ACR3 family arsenite efflux pump ArsB
MKDSWREYLRLFTPIFTFIVGILVSIVLGQVNKIDDKLFKHLTNDELHAPRTIVVTKPEFMIYQRMRDQQMEDIKDAVCDIRAVVKTIRR